MTRLSGATDSAGSYKYRGFRGTYEVTVVKGGMTGIARVTVGDSSGKTRLKVLEENGALVLQGGDAAGKPIPRGSHGVRAISDRGEPQSKILLIR
jgi:hypothetical protein